MTMSPYVIHALRRSLILSVSYSGSEDAVGAVGNAHCDSAREASGMFACSSHIKIII